MLANFTGSFKSLPQEIVDEILEYLDDYWHRRTLIACSLTCKGLFIPARRIIYRRLYVGRTVYTSDEQGTYWHRAPNRSPFHILSVMAKYGLAQYTRKLIIGVGHQFTPQNLRPYLPQFQAFTLLTSIKLHHFNPSPFLPTFEQYFGHLKHQIRSLEFVDPSGSRDSTVYFISQFPNLEDLRFDPFPQHNLHPSPEHNISTIQSSPSLGGTLRVTTTGSWQLSNSFEALTRIPSGLRFRSIEFDHCGWIDPNITIRACVSTLQSLTHVIHTCEFPPLNSAGKELSDLVQLRRFSGLTYRLAIIFESSGSVSSSQPTPLTISYRGWRR